MGAYYAHSLFCFSESSKWIRKRQVWDLYTIAVFIILEDTTIATTSVSLSSSSNLTIVEPGHLTTDGNCEATTGDETTLVSISSTSSVQPHHLTHKQIRLSWTQKEQEHHCHP